LIGRKRWLVMRCCFVVYEMRLVVGRFQYGTKRRRLRSDPQPSLLKQPSC
jgi:hypothetical protein